MSSEDRPMPKIVPIQIALLGDAAHETLQKRFEDFVDRAIDRLTQASKDTGEMVMPLKAKSVMRVKISVQRTADDCLHFAVENEVAEQHPRLPGKTRSSVVHSGMGLVQPLRDRDMALFGREAAPANPAPLQRPAGTGET